MFAKNKVTQSMLDAVNSVLSEKKMSEADLDETGLRKAAYAAHTAGQKMFTFKGKTYPVRIQGEEITYGEAVEEETELDEAMSGEVTRTKTGLIHRSTKAYGGSKPEKDPLDKLKGPKAKELIKKDVEDEKKTRGQYDEAYMKKEELKGDQHKIDKNKNNKIDSHDFAILRGEKKLKEGACEDEVKKHEKKMHGKDGEVAKHEKTMHKEEMLFKDKLLEAVRRSDIPASVRKARGDAPLTPAEVKGPAKDSISDKDNLAKARNEEVEIGEEIIDEASYSAKAARAGKDIGKPGKMFAKIAAKAGERYGSKERGEKVAGAVLAKLRKEDEDWSDEDIDALLEVYDLEERKMTDAEMKKREDIVKGMKKGLAGFKARYGERAKDVMYATATKQAMKEDAAEDRPAITTDTLAGRMPGGKSNSFLSYKTRVKPLDKEDQEGKLPENDVPEASKAEKTLKAEATIAGTSGWEKMKKDVKDKSGAVHTPMSRARDLAQKAFKKVQDKTKVKN